MEHLPTRSDPQPGPATDLERGLSDDEAAAASIVASVLDATAPAPTPPPTPPSSRDGL